MGKGAESKQVLDRVWTINGKQYDLTEFSKQHPGGVRALENAAAHPNGELFVESYHPDADIVYATIEKYAVKGTPELVHPVDTEFTSKINYTFEKNGFYRRVKKEGMAAIRGFQTKKEQKNPKKAKKTNLRGDDIYLLVDCLHLLLLSLTTILLISGSWKAAIATGILRGAVIMRIAHVASHASLSPYEGINNFMYYFSMIFAGTTPEIWSRKHVVRHHINTNEDVLDEDRMEPIKCVAQGAVYHEMHKNQHKYMWALYTHVVAAWAFSDIVGNNWRKAGAMPFTTLDTVKNCLTQFAHVMITYGMPLYFCGFWGLVLIEINTVLTSTIFGFEFIVNHEIDGCDFYNENIGKEADWGKYQAMSSADFHPSGWGAWFFNQLTGGLNLQICHHLFPGVHYRHYPALTEVIYANMEKEGLKPVYSSNVVEAVYRHYKFLENCSKEVCVVLCVACSDSLKTMCCQPPPRPTPPSTTVRHEREEGGVEQVRRSPTLPPLSLD